MTKTLNKNIKPEFKIGEKVKMEPYSSDIGVVVEIVKRSNEFRYRFHYLVEIEKKSLFGTKTVREWCLEPDLGKFIINKK